MATHFTILAKIPWTEEPGGLYSPWGRKKLDMTGHTCVKHCKSRDFVFTHCCIPTSWRISLDIYSMNKNTNKNYLLEVLTLDPDKGFSRVC